MTKQTIDEYIVRTNSAAYQDQFYKTARTISFLLQAIKRFASIQVEFVGLENLTSHLATGKPLIFCPNHESYIDPPIVAEGIFNELTRLHENGEIDAEKRFKSFPYSIAKTELFVFPFKGLYEKTKVIELDRKNIRKEDHELYLRLLAQNNSLVLFPQGTRSKTGEIDLPKPLASVIIHYSGCEFIPVLVEGAYEMLPKNQSWISWLMTQPLKGLTGQKRKITIEYGAPQRLEFDGFANLGKSLDDEISIREQGRRKVLNYAHKDIFTEASGTILEQIRQMETKYRK